jgi:hypothetical protein
MDSFRQLLDKVSTVNRKAWIWIGLGIVAVLSLRNFYVQEVLIGFSLLFVAVSVVMFAIFLLVRASKPIVAWVTPKALPACVVAFRRSKELIGNQVWIENVPHRLRNERLRLNEKYRIVYSRFIGLRPNHTYRVGLRVGGTALNSGFSHQKKISKGLRNWLTQKVSYSDLIPLASRSGVRRFSGKHRR